MSVLSRVLPPPTYLTMPCIGVDISDTSLKYMSFKPTAHIDRDRELKQWGSLSIPSDTVNRGAVSDPTQLAAVLKEFKDTTGASFVSVSLPEERAYLFETEIRRNTPIKEVRGLLEFKLEENVPIASKDVFFDYTILPNMNESKTVQVAVAAYAKETIQQYYNTCLEAGLHPISFEVEAQAMARAMVPKDVKGATMIVDFGRARTGVGIVYKGTLLYTSTIEIGGDLLSESVRKVLGEDISEAEITDLKNTKGLLRGKDSSEVCEAMVGAVTSIKDELLTRMQYWHLRNDNSEERRISAVMMCGGSANLRGLPAYMTEALGVPCVRGNVWENVMSLDSTVPPIDVRHSLGYAAAIGLALRNVA
jgi:type IV pilus assembly protein PilM